MRRWLFGFPVFAVVFALASTVQAQEEVKAIIEKAIKAHGGAEKLDKLKMVQTKAKGTIEIGGGLSFSQESIINAAGKFKEVLNLEVMGQKIAITTVFNGEKGWLNANGTMKELQDKLLDEVKEAAYSIRVGRMTPLLTDKAYRLAPLGESKVNDHPAVGVKISSKGHRDISLYFDKETGLLAKSESRRLDGQTMQEVDEERIVIEYQDVDGQKTSKKVLVNRDGKKFMEAEVTEVKFLDKVDDSQFEKP